MAKLLFLPVSLTTSFLAGLISRKIFEWSWGAIDDQEAPNPKDHNVRFGKLAVALTVEGALFRLVKGLVEHGSRQGFARLTGTWPGEEEPQSK